MPPKGEGDHKTSSTTHTKQFELEDLHREERQRLIEDTSAASSSSHYPGQQDILDPNSLSDTSSLGDQEDYVYDYEVEANEGEDNQEHHNYKSQKSRELGGNNNMSKTRKQAKAAASSPSNKARASGSQAAAAAAAAADQSEASTSGGGLNVPKGHTTFLAGSSPMLNANASVEMRRKNPSFEMASSSSAQRDNWLDREDFSLDHDHSMGAPSHSFVDLPEKDKRNFMLLCLLYFLQGVPMGLASGSVPFLLKSKLSYAQIGTFTLAAYPYSMKLLWSPIVDAIWSPRFGRRKSWILPIQLCSSVMLIWLGGRAEWLLENASNHLETVTFAFFALVFLCATQDIAVDGWALTLISPKNLSYASTAQTVGLTAGQFLSYTVFLAFNSADFANRWFRNEPKDVGLITLGGYLTFWGWTYLIVTAGLAVLKKEDKTLNREGLVEVYKIMWGIMKLKHIQAFIVVHLICKIGFQANDAVTNLKLLDLGFSQEDLALTVLIDFPFEIALGYYAGKWCAYFQPMTLWSYAFVGRLLAAMIAHITVAIFPKDGVETWYLLVVIAEHIFSTFSSTVMFVAVSAFHAKIADPAIGGTYMTLLATVSNLGGTFPRIFVLKLVDVFTAAHCDGYKDPTGKLTGAFSCVAQDDKKMCTDMGGKCIITRDGYYITNILCVIFGVVTFWGFIRQQVGKLQALPLRAWRLS